MTRALPALVALAASCLATLCGCSDDGDADAPPLPPPAKDQILALLSHACDDSLDSIYEAHTEPASWSAANRGDVVACAYDRAVDIAEMTQAYTDHGFDVPTLTTAVHKLRVLYWTERGADEPILASGALYIPEVRRADPAPLLVVGHGSVGVADKCSPSKEAEGGTHKDWRAQLYSLAGDGWVVFHADLPGLGTPGVGTWMLSLDEGHAILDATRATRKIALAGTFSDKNAFVGHSNGGHAVLSAQAHASSYGSDGSVETVVVYAPFWLSNGAWGAMLTQIGAGYMDATFMSMTMQYFYGHLDAYEGPEHALDAFLPAAAGTAQELLEGGCWHDITSDAAGPPSVGFTKASDVFSEEYINIVGACGLVDDCTDPLAQAWRDRWVADRPASDPSIPILHWMGAKDDFVTPGYQQCAIDRIEGTGGHVDLCVDLEGDHSSIIATNAGWVSQYLESKLTGGDAPPACPGVDQMAEAPTCSLPIANSTDPTDP